MPSLAQGYGRGMLLGLQLQDAERQRKRDELTDEFMRERLEDMRFERQTLMSQAKKLEAQEKAETEQEQIRTGLIQHGMQEGGDVTLRNLATDPFVSPETRTKVHGAMDLVPGLDWPQQQQQRRVATGVKGAPGAVPWNIPGLDSGDQARAGRMAAGLEPKAGAGSTRSVTDAERAERYSKIPEDQRTEYQRKFLKKYFEGTRGATGGDWGDPLLNELFGEGGETPTGGEQADEAQQINYEGLAKGLTKEHGITTKQTLESFKDELMQLYPGLKWETLKAHFK